MDYRLYDVLRFSCFTEKSSLNAEKLRRYTFKVSADATKKFVKRAVEKIFDVKVEKVSILNRKGKKCSFKGVRGEKVNFKRAIVKVNKEISFGGGVSN